MTEWPYAKLVCDAQAVGGPERYQDVLVSIGVEQGKHMVYPWLGVMFFAGGLTCFAVSKTIERLKAYKCKKEKIHTTSCKREVATCMLRFFHINEN